MGFRTLAFCLLPLLHLAQTTIPADSRASEAVKQARLGAEKRVTESLRSADPSVRGHVLKQLARVGDLAASDLVAITEFPGPGDRELALNASRDFWIGRMEEEIKIYLQQPQRFDNVKLSSEVDLPGDPNNQTSEYLGAASEVRRLVSEARTELERRHGELLTDVPADVGQVTAWNVRRAASRQALEAAVSTLELEGQYAKLEADRGRADLGLARLRHSITAAKSNFESNIRDIFLSTPFPSTSSS